MKQFISFLGFLFLFSALLQAEPIIHQGASNWSIYLADDAIIAERTAAAELQRYLKQATGAELPIISQFSGSKQILVGSSDAAASLLPEEFSRAWSKDEILIAPAGENLILAGDCPRGTLYAVFEYLERDLGIRFWSADEELVPKHTMLNPPLESFRFAPPITIRAFAFYDALHNHAFAVKRHFCGYGFEIPEAWGGTTTLIGPWHTFDRFLPADKYFEAHPEWYSLVDGKRLGGQTKGQLCLSNKEMRKELLKQVRQELQNSLYPEFISVTQNDNKSFCTCDACQELSKRTGGESGAMIDMVNEIAAEISKDFPDVLLQTFAYQYTRHVPTNRPRSNVSPFICTIERDISRSLDDAQSAVNSGIVRDLTGWGEISRQIDIWDYVTSFSTFLLPLPNIDTTPRDLRLYAKQNAHMVKMQSDIFNPGQPGDLQVLKGYVWGKLLWNPDLDEKLLESEFLECYYGAAAPVVNEYLALRRKSVANLPVSYDCFVSESPWLSDNDLLAGYAILQKASLVAAADPVIAERINTLAKPFEYVLLSRAAHLVKRPGCPNEAQLKAIAADWLKFIERKKITRWAEEWGPESAITGIKVSLKLKAEGQSLVFKTPAFLQKLAAEGRKYYCFEEDAFVIHGGVKMAEIVADPTASNGAAIAIHHTEFGWSPKLYYNPPMERGKTYDCYIALRLDTPATGTLCQYSAWDGELKHDVFMSTYFDAAKVKTDCYTYLPAGKLMVPPNGYSFVAAAVRPEIKQTYIDHIVLVETEDNTTTK